ncbi:MAG TPA: DUF4412 domain-containing protein [Thermoanaerobaculia bacterium]|nr:DUF4412 domain-containing protein [Thermoanaerobaculia bacterium]
MKNQPRTIVLALLCALAAAPSFADIHYKSVTRTETSGKSSSMQAEGWASGNSARVELKESDNPILKPGSFLLTKDGGQTVYLVNPQEKTYAEWDIREMLGAAGAVMNGMGPLLKMEFSEPKVEKLLEEAGPTIAGLPTRHVRYRTSYTMKMKVLGMGNESSVVNDEDIWVSDRLQDAALSIWLRADPPRTGNEQLDKLIAAGRQKFQGIPLKTVAVTTSTNAKNNKQTTTRTTMEVTELDTKANVPGSSFEIPAGYEKTEVMPMAQPGRRP